MRNGNAAQPKRLAFHQAMYVIAHAGPRREPAGQSLFRWRKIGGVSELFQHRISLNQCDIMSGRAEHLCIVSGLNALIPIPVRLQYAGEIEGLRRLYSE